MELLLQVEDGAGKAAAQRSMEASVRAALPKIGKKDIGFPSGNRTETVYSKGQGKLWCAFGDGSEAKVARTWNAFGVFDDRPSRAQTITVEANIPTKSNSARVAGFFARDPKTGAVYLMHDGGIGGGKPGVGRTQFLAWTRPELFLVERTNRKPREAMLIGRVDSPDLPSRLWRLVKAVRAFKDAVDRGEIAAAEMKRRVADLERYRQESSGRRRGLRKAEFDYVSYHGDIVDALQEEREARKAEGERVVNTKLIDLYVSVRGRKTEVFEVKTGIDRQSIYTAVGQLITHSGSLDASVRRFLVVPNGRIPDDLNKCIKTLGITIRRFQLEGGRNKRVVLL